MSWPSRILLAAVLLAGTVLGWAVLARQLAPTSNTDAQRFDAIIVLGYPTDADGNPTPRQLARVNEGVREYERGVAPRLILTGGAAHNGFVEAEGMARTAQAEGIPASAIFQETQAQDTIQNACYSVRIMQAHGWKSAEVVSSASHLPRAGLIYNHLRIGWRTHAAPALTAETGSEGESLLETLKTVRYLVYSQWAERCEP
jgi:uncharacterized SAM-binding protein YcdF (DUF218 family)